MRGAGGVVGGGRGIGVRVEVGPRTGLGGGESRDDVRPVGGEDVLMLVIGRGRRREGWEGREGLRAGGRGGLVVQTAAGVRVSIGSGIQLIHVYEVSFALSSSALSWGFPRSCTTSRGGEDEGNTTHLSEQ